MATLLRVPEVAAGATEVILSEWLVNEKASFSTGEPIVVIETEKAVVEVEAEVDAVLLKALATPGSTVEVGSPMALLGDASEKDADIDALLSDLGVTGSADAAASAPASDEAPAPAASDPAPAEPAAQPADESATQKPEPAPASSPATGSGDTAQDADSSDSQGRVFMSPLARRMLKESGLPVEAVTGTGPGGRIVRRDVELAVEKASQHTAGDAPSESTPAAPQPSTAPATSGAGYTDHPHSRLRRAIATRLTQSKQDIPHFYLKRTVNIDELLALRAQMNTVSEYKISVNDLVIRAVAAAHVQVPEANVIWTDEAIRQFDSVDISVAIAGERGLVTPVLRSVESTSLSGIARSVKEFVQLANDGKLQQKHLEGGSISVTNLGMYGVDEFSAIINPPQSAILAVGAGRPGPTVVDGVLDVATQMTLVLSVDHRAIDGALAARWMDALVSTIEEPLRLVV